MKHLYANTFAVKVDGSLKETSSVHENPTKIFFKIKKNFHKHTCCTTGRTVKKCHIYIFLKIWAEKINNDLSQTTHDF